MDKENSIAMKSREKIKVFLSKCEDIRGYCIFHTVNDYRPDEWNGIRGLQETTGRDIDDISAELEKNLIELRVFNESCEYKLFRSGVGREFLCRIIQSKDEAEGRQYGDFYDQKQFLDIDGRRSKETFAATHTVFPTGGRKKYRLPINAFNEDACIIVRYYLERYKQTGQARVFDWRIVKIDGGVTDER